MVDSKNTSTPQISRSPATVAPAVIGQLLKCEEHLKIFGKEIQIVDLVVRIRNVQRTEFRNTFIITDMTGTMTAVQFHTGDEKDYRHIVCDTYIQIFGGLMKVDKRNVLNVFRVLPLRNVNQIVFHYLRCINNKLKFEKFKDDDDCTQYLLVADLNLAPEKVTCPPVPRLTSPEFRVGPTEMGTDDRSQELLEVRKLPKLVPAFSSGPVADKISASQFRLSVLLPVSVSISTPLSVAVPICTKPGQMKGRQRLDFHMARSLHVSLASLTSVNHFMQARRFQITDTSSIEDTGNQTMTAHHKRVLNVIKSLDLELGLTRDVIVMAVEDELSEREIE
ncbi:Replication protein A 32 kDa subunit [Eumeta japonica]|uniref:Replication protein A 32 kDa subunit n=1 Tax=Eumeta variegata TaxID=151549 RepID=A0A4C1XBZ3_EUMVA|nr:Replication protein A 32 kDa subunit [Eumeta japonica]